MEEISGADWGAAVAAHQLWLRGIIQSHLGEPAAVEDVLQETLKAGNKDGGIDYLGFRVCVSYSVSELETGSGEVEKD